MTVRHAPLAAFAILAVAIRIALVPRDLPYYSIDENEIVEPALAFLCGDWNPRFFAYGPLTSYVLAILFAAWRSVASFAVGWSGQDFLDAAFFAPTSFYAIARALHAAAVLATAALAWRFARRFHDAPTALAALTLALAPLPDLLAEFTIRIDSLQGLLGLAGLFLAALNLESPRRAYAAGAGVLFGLNLAVKPLSALVLLPPLAGAFLVAAWRSSPAGRRLPRTLADPGVWVFVGAALAAHALVNPYAMLRPALFVRENTRWLGSPTPEARPGYELGFLAHAGGWPWALAAAAATVRAFRWRDLATRLLLANVVWVFGVLMFAHVRPYWYNAVLPALLLLVARLVGEAARRLARHRVEAAPLVASVLAIAVVAWPTAAAAREAWHAWHPTPSFERRADRAAQLWIERSVPAGARLLMVGYYSMNLPRIVVDTPKEHGEWAELMMYGRGLNRPWVEAFKAAYRRQRRTGRPLYHVTKVRRHYTDRHVDPERARRMSEEIGLLARGAGAQFVVTASPDAFTGVWESAPDVRRRAVFGSATGHLGDEVKIFEMLPLGAPPGGETSGSRAPAASGAVSR
jgi:hypothetical protein